MKCHACGQENDDKGLFCIACRRPLVAPAAPPTRLKPLDVPREPVMATATAGTAPGGWVRGEDARPPHGRPMPSGTHPAETGHGLVTEDECWRAVIGEGSQTGYYLTRFTRLAKGESASWHWPGALVTWYWLLYRKMWGWAIAYFLAPIALLLPFMVLVGLAPRLAGLFVLAWWAGLFILPGVYANRLYFNRCRALIRSVRAQGGTREQQLARMEARGGTSNIVIVIVAILGVLFFGTGILAAVALPAYQDYTVKAKVVEAMREGTQVAEAVGRQYENSGTLPSDVDALLAAVPHPSRFVKGMRLDATTGVLTVAVEINPSLQGSLDFVPAADEHRHLSWTCATDDLARWAPAACRHATGR